MSDQYASAQFGKDGFLLSLSVFPGGKSGEVSIMLLNHGNVNRKKLPVPSGAKLRHDFPAVTSFITDADAEETAAALRKLLMDDGWQPYGSAGDSMIFKQNAIRLSARVLSPPAEPGKTVIDFTSEQLSADLPAPPDAEHVHYADQNKRLDLEAQGTPQEAVAYYQKALAPAGWQSTTEEPIKDGFEAFMIFRNPAKDMLTLTLRDLQEDKQTRVTLTHQSAAEVAETGRKIDAEIAARKKKEDEEKNKPKPKAFLALPEDADEVQAKPAEIEFQVASGKGKSAAKAIAEQLETDGWKAETPEGDSMAGRMSYRKDAHTIHIDFVDPGIIPAEITISASGVVLEKKE